MERTPDEFVERLCDIFDEVRRVLRSDGTCWVNLGDTYRDGELVGIPWMSAFGLKSRGWRLRGEIIWRKPNALPEVAADRPARCHEQLFLFAKDRRYWYDGDAIRTPLRPQTLTTHGRSLRVAGSETDKRNRAHGWSARTPVRQPKLGPDGRSMGAAARTVWQDAAEEVIERLRSALEVGDESVWSIAHDRWKGEHTSTFPRALVRKCIVAGCPVDGVVLDPFLGTATTIEAALAAGRRGLGIELNEALATEQERRLSGVQLGIGGVA